MAPANIPPGGAYSFSGKRVCLVSSGHIGSNPRLVKEAETLHAAGADVFVIALNVTPNEHVQARDRAIIEQAGWQCRRVRIQGKPLRLLRTLMRKSARIIYRLGISSEIIKIFTYNPDIYWLSKAANKIDADLYIAHNLAALPAAYRAAKQHGAKLGFDAEDFHSGELDESPENAAQLRLIREIESRYLPLCDYLTAASPGIAKAYFEAYGVQKPVVILNVFPKTEAPPIPTVNGTARPSPSLYWFSQTIGPNRGLEVAVHALALATSRPHLYIRGTPIPSYLAQIEHLANDLGITDRLHVLLPALPGAMVHLAAQYDLGIAGEIVSTINRDICLSNKIFTYLQAGIPSLVSDTHAQRAMAQELGEVIQTYPQLDAENMAQCIDALLGNPAQLAALRRRAWKLGQTRYNWEIESQKFLLVVAQALEVRS